MDVNKLEGAGGSQLVQAIRKLHGDPPRIVELATITAPPPTLRIKVDNMRIELESDDLIVAERLTEHTRTVSISGGSDSVMIVRQALATGDRVIVSPMNGGQTYVIIDKAVTYGA